MANVALRNVHKTYPGGVEAIKGIDFEVGDGQFCVLVGPSGCGKSTLLRMVAGLETITGGDMDIGGRIVNQIEPADRAIVRQTKVFLFDKPLSNLDAKLRIPMRVEIRKLQRRLNTTSIYVTHDQLEAMTLADILVVMNGGQVEQIGNPLEIYQKPATTFVAAFIGAPPMNLIPLRDSGIGLDGTDAGILGIRPEDLRASNGAAPDGGVAVELTVEAIEKVGAETYVYGIRSQESDTTPAVSARPGELPPGEILVRIPGQSGPAIGERIRVAAPREKLHLFSADGRK